MPPGTFGNLSQGEIDAFPAGQSEHVGRFRSEVGDQASGGWRDVEEFGDLA